MEGGAGYGAHNMEEESNSVSNDLCHEALQALLDVAIKKTVQAIVTKVSETLSEINKVPELDDEKIPDKRVADAVTEVIESVKTTFVHARSYITKCHELADYICDEEQYTIKAIEEGNVESFKDYMREVLSKSATCQKDIKTLIDYIETEERPLIDKKEKEIESRHSDAKMKATAGASVAGVFGAGTIGSAGLAAAGLAGPHAAVIAPLGLGAALICLAVTIKGGDVYAKYTQIELYCEKAIRAIKELKKSLELIEKRLQETCDFLKLAIDGNLEMIKENDINKMSKGDQTAQQSIIVQVKTIAVQAQQLKEYCQPLINAKTLEDFSKII